MKLYDLMIRGMLSMSTQKRKVTVIGTGFVGASIAYTIAARHLAYEIVLIDINSEKAIGEATDISHALPVFGKIGRAHV